ncbi:MAG: kelch repeat-containing protein [Flavipsychrobacter sp.]
MKRFNITLLLATVVMFLVNTCYAQTWNKKSDFLGGEVHSAYSFGLNGKIYVGGGELSSGNRTSNFYEYDPATDKWTQKSSLPGGSMAEGVAFTINGKGYIGLGKAGTTYSKSLWEYDATNDTWSQKADMPYFSGVFRSRSFVVNSKAYILVGTSSNFVAQNDMYEYDPATNTWTQKANYPGDLRPDLPFTFAIGNKGYVASGEVNKVGGGGREMTKKVYEYDPTTDKWTPKADFSGDPRHMGVAFVYNGMAYCGLGTYRDASFQSVYLDDFQVYNPTTDSWSSAAAYPAGKLRRATATVVGNNAYVGTGDGPGTSKSWYEYGLPLSITSLGTSNNLAVYPNPSKGLLTLNQKGIEHQKYDIYNTQGQIVKSGNIPANKTIDIKSLAIGTYILQVSTKKELLKAQIMIND